ncbi:MAG: glycoside hydrolase family 15 protein [Methylophilaceae bacterium]
MKAPQAESSNPTWAHAGKDMVGTGLGSSRLWFTVAEGIVSEVYYPRIDIPQIKDLGFIIADDQGFWVELRQLRNYEVRQPSPGVPVVTIIHRHPRFTFTLQICPSQSRDVLLLRYQLEGDESLRPYALMAARLGGDAEADQASVSNHNGRTVLCAEQGPFGLALAAAAQDGSDAWQRCSVGYLESSDGWQNFNQLGRMTWQYDTAGPGAVSLMGELPNQATLSLGLGTSQEAAATLAVASLMEDFSTVWDTQCQLWESWSQGFQFPELPTHLREMLLKSCMVLKVHQDRTFTGAAVASLAVPWGETSQTRGGYHLVWCRDLVETAGALIAIGAFDDARDVLRYLIATQQEDGHWLQNQWLGGAPFWQGIQLDETAFPVLLAASLQSHGALDGIPVIDMVRRALTFISREGPATCQDRWEEDAGINTFTVAIAIAALVEGSTFLDEAAKEVALLLADNWNAHLDDWAVAKNTPLAQRLGVEGYYIRTAPADVLVHDGAQSEHILIKNRACDPNLPADEQIGTDFLQLVRYGLRQPNAPYIIDSIKVVDQLLKTDTPNGPVWHRYNGDGYGEHNDGSPFNGTGRGRGWPLLTGERGHYALQLGEDSLPYIEAMAAMTSSTGLLPEQVWDWKSIPEYHLEPGKPSGSAMPLVWAHAEFIKLCFSRTLGYPVDRPVATWKRYQGVGPQLSHSVWGPRYHPQHMRSGNQFSLALRASASVHWGINGWKDIKDSNTKDTGLGVHLVELPLSSLKVGETFQFTFYWLEQQAWDGQDYEIQII